MHKTRGKRELAIISGYNLLVIPQEKGLLLKLHVSRLAEYHIKKVFARDKINR